MKEEMLMKPYYNQSTEEIRTSINGNSEPLTDAQVKEKREKFGYNELVEGKKKSIPMIFL